MNVGCISGNSQRKKVKSLDTKLGIASVVLGVIGLLVAFATWRFPQSAQSSSPHADVNRQGHSMEEGQLDPKDQYRDSGIGPHHTESNGRPERGEVSNSAATFAEEAQSRRPAADSLRLQLNPGEQKLILNGKVGIALREYKVGLSKKQLLSIQISPTGGSQVKLPFTAAGGDSIDFQQANAIYTLSVLQWNSSEQTATIEVNLRSRN